VLVAPSAEEDPAMVAMCRTLLPTEPVNRPEEKEDVVILEECSSLPVEPARALPAGEDILFIE
jgi:hypothetical protein